MISAIGTTAWAQTVIHVTETGTNTLDAASITTKATNGDLYVSIMNHTTSSDKYITSDGTMASTFDAQNGATTWKVVPYGGAYVLQNYYTGKYFGGTSRPATMVDNIENATLYMPEDTEADVGNINASYNSSQSVRWKVYPAMTPWINTNGASGSTTVTWNTGTGNWTCLFTYEVTLSVAYDVTYKVEDINGNVLFTSDLVATPDGTQITELPSEYKRTAFYDYNTIDQTVSSTNTEFTFVATEKANPYMHYSADFANATWYNLMIRGQYMTHNVSGVNEISLSANSEPFADKSSWALIGNPYEGFSVVNKDKGEGYYLVWTTVVDGKNQPSITGDDSKNIQFKSTAEDAEAANKKWILEQNNCSSYPGGFVLRMKDNTNIYFHHNDDAGDANKFLRTCAVSEWSGVHNDPGSTIVPTTDEEALIALFNELSNMTFGNGVNQYGTDGTITTDDATATVTSVGNVVTNHISNAYADAYNALKTLSEKLSLNMPTAGFYRIKGATSNKYLAAGLATNNKFNMTSDVDASTIFYFDGAKLVNYGTGLCNGMSASSWSWTTEANASTVTFEDGNTNGGYGIKSTNAYFYDNGDNSNSADRGQSVNMTSGSERYRKWFLEPVSSLPISLTAVADANYSTLYMPVPVEVSGAEVFTAQLVGEDLRAVALAGAIPANTGVILKGATTEATANIVNAADAVETALTGSVGAIAPVAGSYVFSIVGDELGFYSFGGDELKGFKAYYVSASPVQGFKLDFGSATAIKQAETEKAGQAIYDLSGRRVEKAVKGVYIVGGKKVIK